MDSFCFVRASSSPSLCVYREIDRNTRTDTETAGHAHIPRHMNTDTHQGRKGPRTHLSPGTCWCVRRLPCRACCVVYTHTYLHLYTYLYIYTHINVQTHTYSDDDGKDRPGRQQQHPAQPPRQRGQQRARARLAAAPCEPRPCHSRPPPPQAHQARVRRRGGSPAGRGASAPGCAAHECARA